MSMRCPACGQASVNANDIEAMSDSTLLVKIHDRIQLCCQECGWLGFDDPSVAGSGNDYADLLDLALEPDDQER